MREVRRREFCRAIQALGNGTIESVELGFPDGKLECRDGVGIADQLHTFAQGLQPSAIWASWSGDPHCDHIATAAAAEILGSRLEIPIWSYAVWGRFANRCVPLHSRLRRFDRPKWRHKKAEALRAYRSQMGEVVFDDPGGFSFTPEAAAHFRDAPEIFIRETDL
jgi:LmbE family N-acetylglucosaminyl deacetylase